MKDVPKIELTKKERDCLLAAYREEESEGVPPRLVDLARALGVRPPTALELVRRLESKGLVERRRGLISLSERGREVAKGVISVHRAVESLLFNCGLGADDACRTASMFDFVLDPSLVPRLLELLGNPSTCPHGHPIMEVGR